MMKGFKPSVINHWFVWLIALALLMGLPAPPASAEEIKTLTPPDLLYEDGNIILHKQGERIGPDEWRVNVKATVGGMPVEKRTMEVVFVLDASGSMAWCTDEEAHAQGGHEHGYGCYESNTVQTCDIVSDHKHTFPECYGDECTSNSNPSHWSKKRHTSGDCVWVNRKYYPITCQQHVHTDDCYTTTWEIVCGKVECIHSDRGETPCTYVDENGNTQNYTTRLESAKRAISTLANNLDGIEKHYVAFSSKGYISQNADAIVVSSYADLKARGATYMMAGVDLGTRQFSDDEATKVLVIVTDGESQDGYTSSLYQSFVAAGGVVYTVGFNHSNANLAGMAANGGSYIYAKNADSLNTAFDRLEQALTAMLEDPMGTTVGFEKTSIQEIQTSGGVISSNQDTIYWHPAADGSTTVRNSTIEYSYTVQLNEQADMSGGVHRNVPLNNPTNFLYGIKSTTDAPTQMKSALFPIPHAEYAISSIQTKWQSNGVDILPPTDEESIICDFESAAYIPAFRQDYQTITPIIPIEGTNDYYRYIGTTVTAGGESVAGVDAVDATEPVAYLVIHEYELVDANELVIGGTKTLIGRDFMPDDRFTFTLTAETEGAPMPAQSEITISPQSGTSMAFSFPSVSYTEAGTYIYTIREQQGGADQMIYDTAERTLVVTAVPIGNEIVVSYTLDGEANGHLLVTNRLQTGSLRVTKQSVTSHLPEHQEKVFDFLIHVKDLSERPLNGMFDMQLNDGAMQALAFTNGYARVQLKCGESVVINGLPDGAAYTVTEDLPGGFTVTAAGDTGVIEADTQSEAVFNNAYESAGLYQFIGRKVLEDAALVQDQFSFSVLDETGAVVARGKNNADGSIFLDTLEFTKEHIGTKVYTVVEDPGSEPGIIYDKTVYTVTLTITDKGDGTLEVTDDLNGQPIVFTNRFLANQLTVSKTVAGNLGSKNRAFNFTLTAAAMAGQNVSVSTDGGATFTEMTLDAQGQTAFTLKHDQSVIFYPVAGDYTVTETDPGSYVPSCTINGGEAVQSAAASGSVDAQGENVAFVNTLEAVIPTGVHTSAGSAVAGIFLAACFLVIIAVQRRWAGFAK